MEIRIANNPYYPVSSQLLFDHIPAKLSTSLESNIISKLFSKSDRIISHYQVKQSHNKIYYTRSIRNFRPFFDYAIHHLHANGSVKEPTERKDFSVEGEHHKEITAFLNSNLVFLIFCLYTDVRNINPGLIASIPFNSKVLHDKRLIQLEQELMENLEANKEGRYNKTNKCTEFYYYPKLSKPIIDKIDKVLATHYGFTEEELDFIINYDIKYRMGDELNEE